MKPILDDSLCIQLTEQHQNRYKSFDNPYKQKVKDLYFRQYQNQIGVKMSKESIPQPDPLSTLTINQIQLLSKMVRSSCSSEKKSVSNDIPDFSTPIIRNRPLTSSLSRKQKTIQKVRFIETPDVREYKQKSKTIENVSQHAIKPQQQKPNSACQQITNQITELSIPAQTFKEMKYKAINAWMVNTNSSEQPLIKSIPLPNKKSHKFALSDKFSPQCESIEEQQVYDSLLTQIKKKNQDSLLQIKVDQAFRISQKKSDKKYRTHYSLNETTKEKSRKLAQHAYKRYNLRSKMDLFRWKETVNRPYRSIEPQC